MSPHQLNNLLTSIFPCGGYLVDVEHDVYKIRAPRVISKVRIPSLVIREKIDADLTAQLEIVNSRAH